MSGPVEDYRFCALDETIADVQGLRVVPDEARGWLADQRVMHGLLRALYTADAAAREERVENILAGIAARDSQRQRRHWFAVAAVALVLATLGFSSLLPSSLPTAEAAMARAADQMARPVDRRFRIRLTVEGPRVERVRQEFELIARPGMRFMVEGRLAFAGLRLVDGRIGCDGETLWVAPKDGQGRVSGPLKEREALLKRSRLDEFLDIGCLDVHALIAKLLGGFKLRVLERTLDGLGNPQLRISATRRGKRGPLKIRSAELLVDELTGLVTRMEADVGSSDSRRRVLVMESLGLVDSGGVDYSRPW